MFDFLFWDIKIWQAISIVLVIFMLIDWSSLFRVLMQFSTSIIASAIGGILVYNLYKSGE